MQVGTYSFSIPIQGGTASIVQEADRSVESFVYGVNGGLEVWLSDKITLCLNIGVIASEFEIDSRIMEKFNGTTAYSESISYNQPFSAINIGASIGYNL